MATGDTTASMVLSGPGSLDRREFSVPAPGDGAILEVETTSICGTDIGLYTGKSGRDRYPLVLGHEVVGRIVEAGEETLSRMGVDLGERVVIEPYIPCYACHECHTGNYHMCEQGRCYGVTISAETPPHLWGGYGEYMYLAPNTKVHPVSADVPGRAACLGTVVGNGVRWAVTKGEVSPGDAVVVVGPGAQGLATTIVADEAGADPLVLLGLTSDADRLTIGEDLGATHTVEIDAVSDVGREVREAVGGDPGIVVVTAPSSEAITLALDLAGRRGRVVLPGIAGQPTEIDTDRLVRDEISLIGGRGQANDVERAMDVLERRPGDVARINTHVFPVAEADAAIRKQLPDEEVFDPGIVHAALEPER